MLLYRKPKIFGYINNLFTHKYGDILLDKVTFSATFCRVCKSTSPRKIKKVHPKLTFMQYSEQIENEDDLSSYSESLSELRPEERQDEWKRQQNFIKRKIIERKYFRKPSPPNILSWAAKQQIRYLNSQFPEEWTLDRLTDSFPIDRDSAIKIIKSKKIYVGQEIKKHDERAARNIENLDESTKVKFGIEKLKAVQGIASLPMEVQDDVEITKAPGFYESFYLSYKKKLETVDNRKSKNIEILIADVNSANNH